MFDGFYLNIKLEEGGIMPRQAHPTDAGFDVFSPIDVTIFCEGDAKIPLNWRCEFPAGYCMSFMNKSGRAVKDKLIVGAELVDSNYRGIVHAHLFNLGFAPVEIKRGEKITQFVITPVWHGKAFEVSDFDLKTDRGEGGFGSTGK